MNLDNVHDFSLLDDLLYVGDVPVFDICLAAGRGRIMQNP